METLKIFKIGGQVIDDPAALSSFLTDFSKQKGPKLLIHGGGLEASKRSKQLGVEVRKIDGRRVTSAEALDVIVMTYAGLINKNIVAQLQANDCNALGFSGADANSVISVRRPPQPIDFGFVGDIVKLNTHILEVLLREGVAPVFCAVTHDAQGQLLNTNADTLASELAIAFAGHFKTELYICFEKNGVLTDIENDDSVLEHLSKSQYQVLLKQGKIVDGMIPKLDNCFRAIDHNVSKVCIGKPEMLSQPTLKHTKIIAS
jgi:acetylglutamate kinase